MCELPCEGDEGTMKIKEAHRKTFELYRRVYEHFDGTDVLMMYHEGKRPNYHAKMANLVWWREQPHGCSAVEAFTIWDSQARHVGTLEPERLLEALVGKCLLNERINAWAGGINDGAFCLGDFQDLYPWLPNWVWDAVIGQVDTTEGWLTVGHMGVREYRYNAEIQRDRFRHARVTR